ncbi:hypothetical protein [Bartonella queenslandensis]|uniref:hypothetical protein n=1 Tax=Bartonella queenslandensis TaxID=481138 RepID=UPI001BABB94D|nr:hypothetical protein [Bartonella queenslandensis]
MLDFNHRPNFTERVSELIDQALCAEHKALSERDYLGASRLGENCSRKLQYQYTNAPKDEDFSGRTLRIFAAGHLFEDLAIRWLRLASFAFFTEKSRGGQFGFSVADGRIHDHVDGIINGAPEALGLTFPMLWECKSLNAKSWKDTVKRSVVKSKPVYAAQMATYQTYMEGSVPNISKNPALFTAINKDTAELHFELVPFDASLAQNFSDRAVTILKATEADELLPRHTTDHEHFECRVCAYRNRCWEVPA